MDGTILRIKRGNVVIESVECRLREVPLIINEWLKRDGNLGFSIQEINEGILVGEEVELERDSEFGI
ncbi:MAG: hypothetical protein ACRC2K_06130 [Clostridium sp.]